MAKGIILFSLMALCCLGAAAETRIRDVFAETPDSIMPLLTKNNRLDMIDFRENNMQAVVRNRLEEPCELLVLTDRYLQLRLSEHSTLEMRLLSDSTFCMVQTVSGPARDSRVTLYDTAWHPLASQTQAPAVADFLTDAVDTDIRLSLEALPFRWAALSPDDNTITWELDTCELTREQRRRLAGGEAAQVHPVTLTIQPETTDN